MLVMGEEDSEAEELRKTRVGPKIPIGSLHLPLFEMTALFATQAANQRPPVRFDLSESYQQGLPEPLTKTTTWRTKSIDADSSIARTSIG
jgi:hypothetical protein